MAVVSKSTFRHRRQVLIALALSALAFIGDTVSKNGSDLPVMSVIITFVMLSTGPIVLNRMIEMLTGEDDA